ncbi:MAG: PQQ-dependent sugar dehydrogenase [Acidobacteria bacterium]|nr:PQQ-dependent sugar dehydrogenase [Acidobacteriota bacterium]
MRILIAALLFANLLLAQPTLTEVIGSGQLSKITSITNAGDERLFILEQDGRIRIFENNGLLATPFLDIASIVNSGDPERGLLGLAFHPDYAQNGYFFVNYTIANGDGRVARYQVSNDPNLADPASGKILITIPHPGNNNHNGGAMAFGPDGYLYFTMGDGGGGGDPNCNAQNLNDLRGKMLRLDVDQNINQAPYHGIPPSNPFVGVSNTRSEIWAYGLRNPWKFSFDQLTGDMFIGDVGQGSWEEIDFQPANSPGGENYGWKVMEGNHCFGTSNCQPGIPACFDPLYVLPILEYSHSFGCSVTGGYRYRGCFSEFQGQYLYGDYCSGRIWAATEISPGVWSTTEIFDTTLLITSFGEDIHGNVYVAGRNGPIHRIDGDLMPYWAKGQQTCPYTNVTILDLLNQFFP